MSITKICPASGSSFLVTDEDFAFYNKIGVSSPTLCPEERERRRLAWRNERKLYKRKCDACQKQIISIYSEDKPFTVYCSDCWWSDNWDALKFGSPFDFTKPFFKQFKDLQQKVPRLAILNQNSENSDYTNNSGYNKNCYFVFAGSNSYSENCMYDVCIFRCFNAVDGINLRQCEMCYECTDAIICNHVLYSQYTVSCSDSSFLFDCRNCSHCTACVNIRNKSYCFFNEQLTKEAYEKKLEEWKLHTNSGITKMKKVFKTFREGYPVLFSRQVKTDNCTGDSISESKNAHHCFDCDHCEDVRYSTYTVYEVKDSLDGSYVGHVELANDNQSLVRSQNGIGCNTCWDVFNARHCDICFNNSHDIFGCIGLKKKEYCILNKQYTPEEYKILVPQIIEHMKKEGIWGEFFPIWLSPFAYNETVAQEYFPLTKEETLKKGYAWKDEENKITNVTKIITKEQMSKLPESIESVPDDVLSWAFTCEVSGKLYKIQTAELKFYRQMNIPLPRKHPDVRHIERVNIRNPRKLWSRKCAECAKSIETTYDPHRPEKVLCEECYQKAVY